MALFNFHSRGVKGATKRKEDVVFQMLFVHVGFQIFSDPKMAQEVLEELHICYQKSNGKKKRKSLSNAEPEWIEVVVDLLVCRLIIETQMDEVVLKNVFF